MKTSAKNKGSLLIEVLIAIALFLAISTIIAQALYVSFYGSRDSESKLSMNSLIGEQVSNIRAISDEHWSNIGNLATNTDYYVTSTVKGLSIATGTYSGVSNGMNYKISFKINEANRVLATSSAMLQLSTSTDMRGDDATLIITSMGVLQNKEPIVIKTILTRWRNIVCSQSRFDSTSTSVSPCEINNIYVGSKTNIEAGETIKLCNGCK